MFEADIVACLDEIDIDHIALMGRVRRRIGDGSGTNACWVAGRDPGWVPAGW